MILAHKHHAHFQPKQLSSHKHFNEEVSHNWADYRIKLYKSRSFLYEGLMRKLSGQLQIPLAVFCLKHRPQFSEPPVGGRHGARPPHCQNPTMFQGQRKSTSSKSHNSSRRQIRTFLTKGRRQEHWAAGKSRGWSWKHILVSCEELLQTQGWGNSC